MSRLAAEWALIQLTGKRASSSGGSGSGAPKLSKFLLSISGDIENGFLDDRLSDK